MSTLLALKCMNWIDSQRGVDEGAGGTPGPGQLEYYDHRKLNLYCLKVISFLGVQKMRRTLLSAILHIDFCKLKTIACNAHYKVVALTLRQ